jgi:hypothetical protein
MKVKMGKKLRPVPLIPPAESSVRQTPKVLQQTLRRANPTTSAPSQPDETMTEGQTSRLRKAMRDILRGRMKRYGVPPPSRERTGTLRTRYGDVTIPKPGY